MRHTVEKHEVSCGCRSVGECTHNQFVWMRALDALVDDFAEAMKKKLRKKFMEGKHGWDDPEWPLADIRLQMVHHCGVVPKCSTHEPDEIDPVDVANFAAFLWNREGE